MHDTPPGRPHGPEPDAGPDDALVGELRELMERAAAGLAPLPDLTREAVRLGRRRRIRARVAVVGAVAGVLAAGGIGSAALGGLGSAASPPVGPAAVPPTASLPSSVPSPVPSTSTFPTPSAPVPTSTAEAVRRAHTADALTLALGDLIGTVSPDGAGLFAGRIDGHVFPVTFQVMQGTDTLAECPDPAGKELTCRTAWLSGGTEARLLVTGGDRSGSESLSVSYRYAGSTVQLTVGPDTAAGVSPPVTADQLVAAAGSDAVLAAVKYEAQYEARYGEGAVANPSDEVSDAPSSPVPPATTDSVTAEPSLAGAPSSTSSETGGSPR